MIKRLYRSKKEKIWAGICGGIGEYADIDPTVIRIAWLFIALVTGIIPGLIAYIIAAIIIPTEGHHKA